MAYTLNVFREKRFSTKIIMGKIRRKVPSWFYNILLAIRYTFYPTRCSDLEQPSIKYSDGSWVNRKTTSDLTRIQDFLLRQQDGLAIFQAGIGNSSLYRLLQNKIERFVGVTISEEEVSYAAAQFPEDFGHRYEVRLSNKYTADIKTFGQDFDYIIDNDISSYACCKHHFEIMLTSYRSMLKPEGAVLVGFLGLGYFDMGFGLSEKRMKQIAARCGFSFERGEPCYFLKQLHKED